ncbi:hypothetical protein [Paenibacillus senegalensis]|uniref:hypothetical protein n=1 Tax=Paenibacillus senegalensis TaxID=1465766 RepID=UPI0002885770|nr:hypothetical protein [Paenibacillus senegalensis]
MSKARLTYRFDNGRDPANKPSGQQPEIIPLQKEEYKVMDSGPELNQFTTHYGEWKSPFDEETEKIEKLIRESAGTRSHKQQHQQPHQQPPAKATAASFASSNLEAEQERLNAASYEMDERDYEYDYSPGYSHDPPPPPRMERAAAEDYNGYKAASYSSGNRQPVVDGSARYVRYSKTPWLKVGAAVAGAVATGVLLGLLVLSLFNSDQLPPASDQRVTEGSMPVGTPVEGGSDQGDTANPGAAPAAAGDGVQVQIPAKTYTILQNGGFSQAEGAETAVKELLDKGLAGVREDLDKHYVYAGIAADRTAAASLSLPLQNQQVEIYVKTYTLPAVPSIRWEGNTETLLTYLAQSDQLVQIISGMTAVHLEGTALTPMEEASLQTLKEKHEAWTASAAAVNSEAPDEIKPILQKLDTAMNTAKQSIDEYRRNPSAAMLWQAQTSLLQFVLAEKELLQMIEAS